MRDLPSGTVTFLFTDVEGSTKLLHDLGADGYAKALAEHRRVIREACAAHNGAEVDTQGDAFFFAFPTAPGALSAAAAMTEALAPGPIQVRIGLHTGEPLLAEEGYVGDDVHFAARVASSGHGGQVILSAATADLVELELTDLGEHRFKDIPKAVPIYQLGDGSFPPLKTISNTNLPRPASSFVGRESETEDIVALLRDGARLVTLSGPGGTGKTRLAIEAASELVPEFKAGVFWVGLATLRDPALVTETIMQTLGAKEGLADHVGEREMLLLLDNLEQVVDAAQELADLLEACPNLRLLVTSRELLRVRGEVEYAVPPLAEPEAIALFCQRSQLDADETIAELCRRLDNLPLAVELAAARTNVLAPEQILERLSQRLDLLKGGRDADPRQQTLRATIVWSYELLSSEEQQLFGRLSVFVGGCTLEAAEEVCDADLDALQSLVEKSLLRFTNGRYWMLETIREYADERLESSFEADGLRRRFAEEVLALAEEAEPHLRVGPDQVWWVERLEREHENVRAALAWWFGSDDINSALRLAAGVFRFWELRPRFGEAAEWLEKAIEAGSEAPPHLRAEVLFASGRIARWRSDLPTAANRLERAVVLYRKVGDDQKTSACLGFLANVLLYVGQRERAEQFSEQSVEVARKTKDPPALAGALHNRGVWLVQTGDLQSAGASFEEGLGIFRSLGLRSAVANALVNLGGVNLALGDTDSAAERFTEGVAVAGELGGSGWKTMGLRGLGQHALVTGDLPTAGQFLEDALALARDQDDDELIVACLKDLACVAAARGEAARAQTLAGVALELERNLGVPSSEVDRRIWSRYIAAPASDGQSSRSMTREEAVTYALGP